MASIAARWGVMVPADYDSMRLDYMYRLVLKEVEDEKRALEAQASKSARK